MSCMHAASVGSVPQAQVPLRDITKQAQTSPRPRRLECEAHKQPQTSGGQPFSITDHFDGFKREGLLSWPKELKGALNDLKFKPPGKPKTQGGRTKTQGGRTIYLTPKWHFQRPA